MKNFAFIVCITSIKRLKEFLPLLRLVPDFLARPALKDFPAFKLHTGSQGRIIACPVLQPEDEFKTFEKISRAAVFANADSAGILGLGGCCTLLKEKQRFDLAKQLNVPLTTGAAFTAWSVFEAVHRIAKTKGLDLSRLQAAILGAGTCVGSALAKKLSGYVSKLTLVSAEREKLQDLKRAILQVNSLEVTTAATLHAATNIDILIHLEGACDRMEELKTGAIILTLCPKLKLPPQRKDLTLIRTGLIKLPDAQSFKLQPGLPRGIVTASLAETMLLALEEKFTSYSLTDNINPDKLEEIADIAARRGFEVWVPQAPVL